MAKTITTIKKIAVLGKRELRYTEVQGVRKFDIRAYKGDKYEDGVRFTQEEINQLYFKMKSGLDVLIGNKTLVFDNNEYALSIENNGRIYTRPFATKDEMDKLMQILEVAKDNLLEYDPTPKVEASKKKRGRPAKEEKSVIPADIQAKLDALKVAPKKSNIIQFPKPKPEVEKVVTKGNATYEDCVNKLSADKEKFKDPDSQYVIDGLLELCKVDADFRNNVMREGKNFSGVMLFMSKMCHDGYGYLAPDKRSGWVDRNLGLGIAIDYFNMADKPKPETKEKKSETKETKKRKEA